NQALDGVLEPRRGCGACWCISATTSGRTNFQDCSIQTGWSARELCRRRFPLPKLTIVHVSRWFNYKSPCGLEEFGLNVDLRRRNSGLVFFPKSPVQPARQTFEVRNPEVITDRSHI